MNTDERLALCDRCRDEPAGDNGLGDQCRDELAQAAFERRTARLLEDGADVRPDPPARLADVRPFRPDPPEGPS